MLTTGDKKVFLKSLFINLIAYIFNDPTYENEGAKTTQYVGEELSE